jgi:hypothetical protein
MRRARFRLATRFGVVSALFQAVCVDLMDLRQRGDVLRKDDS